MDTNLSFIDRALVKYAQASALPEPSSSNMSELVRWLRDQHPGRGNLKVRGPGSEVWGDQYSHPPRPTGGQLIRSLLRTIFLFWEDPESPRTRSDLAIPRWKDPDDHLTLWIRDEWIPLWHKLWNPDAALDGKKNKQLSPLPLSVEKPASIFKRTPKKVGNRFVPGTMSGLLSSSAA